jgi:hypothetical protein
MKRVVYNAVLGGRGVAVVVEPVARDLGCADDIGVRGIGPLPLADLRHGRRRLDRQRIYALAAESGEGEE